MNGLTPPGDAAEAWFIVFRAVQGFGAALMLPAALAIVVGSYELRERGKALAIFFAITGGLTARRPDRRRLPQRVDLARHLLDQRAGGDHRPDPRVAGEDRGGAPPGADRLRGLVLIVGGMGLSVLGFQQASQWGWDSDRRRGRASSAGSLLLVVFVLVELRTENPLIRVQIFENRAFTVENVVLFFTMVAFIPVFFFASMYAQIALGNSVSEAGLYLLDVLRRVRGGVADRRAHARQRRRQAPGRARLRGRGGRLRAVGQRAHRPRLRRPVVLHRHRGRGHGPDARARQHRRDQPRAARQLRRGVGRHADGAQLRRQPRHGRARHHPDQPEHVERRALARRRSASRSRRPTRSRTASPAAAAHRRRAHRPGGGDRRRSRCSRRCRATSRRRRRSCSS